MLKIKFYENVTDQLLKFAVIVSQYEGKWVFCKHKERVHMNVPVDIEKVERVLRIQRSANYGKKRVQNHLF